MKNFLMIGFVVAVLVACGGSRNSETSPSSITPQNVTLSEVEGSSEGETSVSSSSSAKSSSSEKKTESSSSMTSSLSSSVDSSSSGTGESSSSSGGLSSSSSTESSSSVALSSSSSAKSSSSSAKSSSSVAYVEPCRTDSVDTCEYGTLTDERDGQTYKTVKIGTQTWMAENLNYAYTGVPYKYTYKDSSYTSDSTSWCYDNVPANCAKYGRLYTWAAAMDSVGTWSANGKGCGYGQTCSPTYPVRGACPKEWHLPSQREWNTLFTAVGGKSTASKMLKSTSGWNDYKGGGNGNGTDAYAFSALPTGDRYYNGNFNYEGDYAYIWSSTESNSYFTYYMFLNYYDDGANLRDNFKNYGLSVRCVKD